MLKSEAKPVRITVRKVGYLIGERALLEKSWTNLQRLRSFYKESRNGGTVCPKKN